MMFVDNPVEEDGNAAADVDNDYFKMPEEGLKKKSSVASTGRLRRNDSTAFLMESEDEEVQKMTPPTNVEIGQYELYTLQTKKTI